MSRTGIGPSIQHIIQHSILVHIKPVSNVSQSVWTAGITVKGIFKFLSISNMCLLNTFLRIQGVLRVNEDDFPA